MSPTDVLGEAWELYKRHWKHLLPIAFVVYVLLSLLTLVLIALLGTLGALLSSLVSLAGIFWLQGALVVAVEDVRDGRADLTIGETLSRVRPRINTLAVAGVLAAIAVGIGFVLLIVPGFVLLTWWLFIVPVIMLEDTGITESFGRSRELVRGNGWQVFALILLTILLLLAATIVLGLLLSPLRNSLQGYVSNIVSSTLLAPFVAAAWTLAYYRLRGRETQATAAPAPL